MPPKLAVDIESNHFEHRSPEECLAEESRLLQRGALHLFTYTWNQPVLVLGRGQSLENINTDTCRKEGIPILRRSTGGTGVLHQHTLNIALFLPRNHPWSQTIAPLYGRFTAWVKAALTKQSFSCKGWNHRRPSAPRSAICFESHTDDTLLIEGRKVFGSAQRRQKTGVLIHGTLLLDLDVPQHSRVFGVPKAHIRRIMCALPYPLDVRRFIQDFRRAVSEANTFDDHFPPQ